MNCTICGDTGEVPVLDQYAGEWYLIDCELCVALAQAEENRYLKIQKRLYD